jgi:hypothetical protein
VRGWMSRVFREAAFFPARKVGFCLCSKGDVVVAFYSLEYLFSMSCLVLGEISAA